MESGPPDTATRMRSPRLKRLCLAAKSVTFLVNSIDVLQSQFARVPGHFHITRARDRPAAALAIDPYRTFPISDSSAAPRDQFLIGKSGSDLQLDMFARHAHSPFHRVLRAAVRAFPMIQHLDAEVLEREMPGLAARADQRSARIGINGAILSAQ